MDLEGRAIGTCHLLFVQNLWNRNFEFTFVETVFKLTVNWNVKLQLHTHWIHPCKIQNFLPVSVVENQFIMKLRVLAVLMTQNDPCFPGLPKIAQEIGIWSIKYKDLW
jgi:hypothetical protein